jgi:putative membrane protein
MIRDYSDHAANERTYLAWVRTGVAIIALGFVIEKFNLFVLTILGAIPDDSIRLSQLHRLSGPLGRYGGVALVVSGLALIVIATLRFARTGSMLDDQQTHGASRAARIELTLLTALVLIVGGFSAYLALG